MSPQMAGFAPATRVVSRKLGPTSGSRSDSSASVAAASRTSTLAITWGTWLTVAISRSWVSASMAWGRAPKSAMARCRRSYSTPLERSVGVRYQRAPSNRSARAFSTPAVSAPANGCPPMNRSPSSSDSPPSSASLVEPTSVTTASSALASSASGTSPASAPMGAAQKTISAPWIASTSEAAAWSRAPSSSARSALRRSKSKPVTSASSRSLAASPIDPPIRPTPTTASLIPGGEPPPRRRADRGSPPSAPSRGRRP